MAETASTSKENDRSTNTKLVLRPVYQLCWGRLHSRHQFRPCLRAAPIESEKVRRVYWLGTGEYSSKNIGDEHFLDFGPSFRRLYSPQAVRPSQRQAYKTACFQAVQMLARNVGHEFEDDEDWESWGNENGDNSDVIYLTEADTAEFIDHTCGKKRNKSSTPLVTQEIVSESPNLLDSIAKSQETDVSTPNQSRKRKLGIPSKTINGDIGNDRTGVVSKFTAIDHSTAVSSKVPCSKPSDTPTTSGAPTAKPCDMPSTSGTSTMPKSLTPQTRVPLENVKDSTKDSSQTSNLNFELPFKDNDYRCALCPYIADDLDYLRHHIALHGNMENPYPCRYCTLREAEKEALDSHVALHFTPRIGSRVRQRVKRTYLDSEGGEPMWTCVYCGIAIKDPTEWLKHQNLHIIG